MEEVDTVTERGEEMRSNDTATPTQWRDNEKRRITKMLRKMEMDREHTSAVHPSSTVSLPAALHLSQKAVRALSLGPYAAAKDGA